jgi:hypothetical protein
MPVRGTIKDLTGQRFGQLLVTGMLRESNITYCICQCDCGGTWQGRANCLQTGYTNSCGCLRRGPAHNRRNFVGERFGHLVVVHQEYRDKRRAWVRAQCDCGVGTWEGPAYRLVQQWVASCGCHSGEAHRKSYLGSTYGFLVVTDQTYHNNQGAAWLTARCQRCGGIWQGGAENIVRGGTRSCGCLREDYVQQVRKSPAHNRERRRLTELKRRTIKLQLPTMFTRAHLEFMLQYWKGCCCVCGRESGSFWHTIALDHWIPLSDPGCPGTIPSNIVPLCHAKKGATATMAQTCCNNSKHNKEPLMWLTTKLGPRKASAKLREIQTYFALTQQEAA